MHSEASSERDESTLSRKVMEDNIYYPYRKPTQVDEERIHRPAGEALLRNSAKIPRNFGRRGTHVNE